METTKYVIAIKPIKDFNHNPIPEDKQFLRYAGIEYPIYGSPTAPCFTVFNEDTVTFDSVEQAEMWWENTKNRLIPYVNAYYDPSTLCIQKRIVKVETKTIKGITL